MYYYIVLRPNKPIVYKIYLEWYRFPLCKIKPNLNQFSKYISDVKSS